MSTQTVIQARSSAGVLFERDRHGRWSTVEEPEHIGFVVVAHHENAEIGTEVVERYLVGGDPGYTVEEARANALADATARTSADIRREGPYTFRAYALVEIDD